MLKGYLISKEIQTALPGTLMTLLFKAGFYIVLRCLTGKVWFFSPCVNSCLIFVVIVCRKCIIKEAQNSCRELGSQVLPMLLILTTDNLGSVFDTPSCIHQALLFIRGKDTLFNYSECMKGCTELHCCLFQELRWCSFVSSMLLGLLVEKKKKVEMRWEGRDWQWNKNTKGEKIGILDPHFSIFHALETGFEDWWLYARGRKGIYEIASIAGGRLGQSRCSSASPHPSSPPPLYLEHFFLPFQQCHMQLSYHLCLK